MPANVVKTPEDERLWEKAKNAAEEAGEKENWPYVMAIFQKMKGKSASELKTASTPRYDERFLASNGKWYLILGNDEHDEYEDSTAYGPFPSEAAVDKYSQRFSNSRGGDVDDSGTQAPPTKSPNGGKLVSPKAGLEVGWRPYGGGNRWADESAKKIAAEFLTKNSSSYEKDLDESKPVKVDCLKGLKSTQVTKKFKNMAAYDKWSDSEEASNYTVQRVYQDENARKASEPPFHLAAKADEALGQAYLNLVSLKMGFDSWEEIPQSTLPLYNWIGKAISQVADARKATTQVREMVRQKKY